MENLSGVVIRCGQDRPDEYGKTDGQDVKRGVITTRLSLSKLVQIQPALVWAVNLVVKWLILNQ